MDRRMSSESFQVFLQILCQLPNDGQTTSSYSTTLAVIVVQWSRDIVECDGCPDINHFWTSKIRSRNRKRALSAIWWWNTSLFINWTNLWKLDDWVGPGTVRYFQVSLYQDSGVNRIFIHVVTTNACVHVFMKGIGNLDGNAVYTCRCRNCMCIITYLNTVQNYSIKITHYTSAHLKMITMRICNKSMKLTKMSMNTFLDTITDERTEWSYADSCCCIDQVEDSSLHHR